MFINKNIFICLAPILLLFLFSCGKPKSDESENLDAFCIPDSLMRNITYDTLKTESVMSALSLSGKITFNEDHVATVFPVVSGNVNEVNVSLGDYVEKGQVLATIRSSDMAGYYGDFKTAQSALAIAKKNMDVTKEMLDSGVSSEKDFITAQNEYQQALSQFNKAHEVFKIYGGTQAAGDSVGSKYFVKSPISGFIVEKNVNTGMELRADDNNSLFTISDLKEVWVVANVYETDISRIEIGSEAEISTLSYPDKKFSGKVERISNVLNPETNVMTVKIRLSNPDYTLKPGMFANVSILFPEQKKMMMIPTRSIFFDDNRNYVVSFRKRCDVSLQSVTIYKSFNDKSYIECDSLHEGDLVVARNGLFVFTAIKKF